MCGDSCMMISLGLGRRYGTLVSTFSDFGEFRETEGWSRGRVVVGVGG